MRYLHCTMIFLIRNSHFDLYYLYSSTSIPLLVYSFPQYLQKPFVWVPITFPLITYYKWFVQLIRVSNADTNSYCSFNDFPAPKKSCCNNNKLDLYRLYHYLCLKYIQKTSQDQNPERLKFFLKLYVLKRMIIVCGTGNAWFYWILGMWCCKHVTNARLLITPHHTSKLSKREMTKSTNVHLPLFFSQYHSNSTITNQFAILTKSNFLS